MFDELKKYKNNNHFFVKPDSNLEKVCNAPKTGSGIYLVYELKRGKINLVYIGSSGKVQNNGKIKQGIGGLYDQIVNGHQFGEIPRKISWIQKLNVEKIDGLDVYWYETFTKDIIDIPAFVEAILIQRFYEVNLRLPDWNNEF